MSWALLLLLILAFPGPFLARADEASGAPLRFLGNAQLSPYIWLEDGKPLGLVVDLARALAQHASLDVRIEAMDWTRAQALVRSGAADALLQINPSSEREQLYDFSDPLLASEFHLFRLTRRPEIHGLASLAGKRVGVEAGGLPLQYLQGHGQVEPVLIPSWQQGFEMLAAGRIDAVLVDRWVGEYELHLTGIQGVTVVEPAVVTSISRIAVAKGNQALLRRIDAGLRAIAEDGTRERILREWRGKQILYVSRESMDHMILAAAGTVILLLVVSTCIALAQVLKLRKANRLLAERERALVPLQALRESELRYRTLVDATGAVTWSCPPSGLHVEPQPAWMAFTGQSAEEMLGAGWTRAVHPDDLAGAAARWSEAVARGAPFTSEHRIRRHDGQWRWMHVQVAPIRDAEGQILEWIGMNLDITERKQSEAALESAKRQAETEKRSLEAVLQALPVGVIVTDTQGAVVMTNRRDEDIWGARPTTQDVEDYAQYRAWWADSGQPVAPHEWASARAVREGESVIGQILEIERFDGSHRYVHNSAVPIRNERGKLMGCAVAIQDITDLRRAEEALRLADRRKDAFLATLGHELRNPLAPIRNACAILKLTGGSDPTVTAARELIDRQVSHLVRLVDDLLDVSRITRGKLSLKREPIELAAVLERALEVARPLIDAAGHRLSVALPPESILLEADPVRLAQVFANLLNNACKYTPSGGAIRLAVTHTETTVVVEVADTGIGIPAEHVPKLFEMFHQVPTDSERVQTGLGIGLALVEGLVTMHGGQVSVHSDGPGTGSTFRVCLPVLSRSPLAPTLQVHGPEPLAPAEGRVLVVDDQDDVAESLAALLRLRGIAVETAPDGLEALTVAERFRPDLVLLDLGMPKLDGFETCRQLRATPWGAALDIVAITGWGQADDRARSAAAGFDAHWVKPIEPGLVLDRLASIRMPIRAARLTDR